MKLWSAQLSQRSWWTPRKRLLQTGLSICVARCELEFTIRKMPSCHRDMQYSRSVVILGSETSGTLKVKGAAKASGCCCYYQLHAAKHSTPYCVCMHEKLTTLVCVCVLCSICCSLLRCRATEPAPKIVCCCIAVACVQPEAHSAQLLLLLLHVSASACVSQCSVSSELSPHSPSLLFVNKQNYCLPLCLVVFTTITTHSLTHSLAPPLSPLHSLHVSAVSL
jgi:hypothetical protein